MRKKVYLSVSLLVLSVVLIVVSLFSKTSAPVFAFENTKLNCKSYVLVDFESGKILAEENKNMKAPVASICKLMTSLITLENVNSGKIDWSNNVVVSEHAASMEGSQAFLDANNKYNLGEIFKSVVVASANDGAVVLAEHIAGSEDKFVELMNKRAKELGMNNTVYENATGLPTPSQHSTAEDTAILLKEISKYNKFNENCNIWMDKLTHPSGRETQLVNTNRLIKYYEGCVNGKTGFTDEAGYCLASSAKKNNMHLISVVLGCSAPEDRFLESKQLLDYGFNNFVKTEVVKKGAVLNTVPLSGAKASSVNVVATTGYSHICAKGEETDLQVELEVPKVVKAPLKVGDVCGKAIIINNGNVVAEVNLTVEHNVEKQSYNDVIGKIIKNWQI